MSHDGIVQAGRIDEERYMFVYIAYRDLMQYYSENSGLGGVLSNHDQRFYSVKDDLYMLVFDGQSYAVSKTAAEKFIEEVRSKCGEEHLGFFPLIASLNGKNTAAVVEMCPDNGQYYYYDMDDEVLLEMLKDLKSGSDGPMSRREEINYCYPNPKLPDDFDLKLICHQIYTGPDNTPVSVVRSSFPDKETSLVWISDGNIGAQTREGNNILNYDVPSEILPFITERVRELCREPAEAYVEAGNRESFIKFGKADERIFTDPDKTLQLIRDIASKSTLVSTEKLDESKFYHIGNGGFFPGAFGAFAGGGVQQQVINTPSAETDNGPKCPFCGALCGANKFCTECGAKLKD